VEYLDVGPTVGASLNGRPLPDQQLDFEDLFLFAGNFNASSQVPQLAAKPAQARRPRGAGPADAAGTTVREAGAPEEFRLDAPVLVTAGEIVTATLGLRAGARIQGFSARLAWNAEVVQPVEMRPGGFIEEQGGIVLAPRPGTVDAALLGQRARGIEGEGTVATVTFRVLRTGDAGIRLASLVARDAANQPLGPEEITHSGQPERPLQTALLAPAPNPIQSEARLTFALSEPGEVELVVYGVDGRRVRVLASGWRAAGIHHAAWDGRDENRRTVAPGVYYARLTTGGRRFTQKMVYLR
jgi:Cohesin domain/FlgD Ig-like domain